jgi:hypothetical protein
MGMWQYNKDLYNIILKTETSCTGPYCLALHVSNILALVVIGFVELTASSVKTKASMAPTISMMTITITATAYCNNERGSIISINGGTLELGQRNKVSTISKVIIYLDTSLIRKHFISHNCFLIREVTSGVSLENYTVLPKIEKGKRVKLKNSETPKGLMHSR